jgi:hypothetical protein
MDLTSLHKESWIGVENLKKKASYPGLAKSPETVSDALSK